jgi:hypothetical protein
VDEEKAAFNKRRAWSISERLGWLQLQGCGFSFNVEDELLALSRSGTEWKPEYAAKAAASLESRGGSVTTDTEHTALLAEPLGSTLSKAIELGGRTDDILVERDPFLGLCRECPARAFAALTHAGKRGEFPTWAWQTFLTDEARKTDKPRLARAIGERLASYPAKSLSTLIRPASRWLSDATAALPTDCLGTFDRVIDAFVHALQSHPSAGRTSIVSRKAENRDWTMEAINAPVGMLAQALFSDPRKNGLERNAGFPPEWLRHVRSLLGLSGDLRRFALTIFVHNLNWFYAIDPAWTSDNLVAALEGRAKQDREAAFAGFLWGGRVPTKELYLRLKPALVAAAGDQRSTRGGYDGVLAGMLLAGWGTRSEGNEQFVTNEEMREVLLKASNSFRSQALWQVEKWSNTRPGEGVDHWSDLLPEFFTDVWPRHKAVRTPEMSARLCEIAFSNEQRFQRIAPLILPLLTTIERDHLRLPELRRSESAIVANYPRETLDLLHAVLPASASAWPYGIEGALEQLGGSDSAVREDPRLVELTRRWNTR